MLPPIRLALPLAAALVAGPLTGIAAADGGACDGARDRPACTILRPVHGPPARSASHASPECVVIVGGLGSATDNTDEGFFRAVLGEIADDVRFRMIRFGVDEGSYRTTGDLSRNGEELRSVIGHASDECEAVHVLAHSMGGVVADRALSKGVAASHGIATYVALASPHNGANGARAIRPAIEADALFAAGARLAAGATGMHDPTSEAVRDLARTRAPLPVRAEAAVRLRVVTDAIVIRRDVFDRRVDVREYMPRSMAELEGHEQIVHHPLAQQVVRGTIATRRALAEARSAEEVREAELASVAIDGVLATVEEGARHGLLTAALASRSTPLGTVANALAPAR